MMRFCNRGVGITLVAMATLTGALLAAAPASAESAWDANDVRGPLDLRWIGASFMPHDRSKLTVSFYDDFRARALAHRRPQIIHRGVRVHLTKYFDGFFRVRPNGHIVFIYWSLGSSCCNTARVERPSRTVLRVIFPTIHDAVPGAAYHVRPVSTWLSHGERVRDRTRELRLGRPPTD
jgi:hypothetical protein